MQHNISRVKKCRVAMNTKRTYFHFFKSPSRYLVLLFFQLSCDMFNVRGHFSADTICIRICEKWKSRLQHFSFDWNVAGVFFWCKVELRRCLYSGCDELTHLCGGALAVCYMYTTIGGYILFKSWRYVLNKQFECLRRHITHAFRYRVDGRKDSENIFSDPILSRCSTYLRKQHEESNEMAA